MTRSINCWSRPLLAHRSTLLVSLSTDRSLSPTSECPVDDEVNPALVIVECKFENCLTESSVQGSERDDDRTKLVRLHHPRVTLEQSRKGPM